MENLIDVRGISKRYGGFALKDVTFSLPKGCIMGLIGENGAGKTTLIRLMLNMVKKDGGEILLFGMDSVAKEKEIKSRVGVALDECYFHDVLTPYQVGKIMKDIFPAMEQGLFADYLKQLEVPEKKPVKELSRGMKMKLSLAAALARRPELLLLDEAAAGLDPLARNDILDILMDFIQDENRGVLISSHITSDLEKICDYITYLHKGEVALSAAKDTLLEEYGIVKAGREALDAIDPADLVGRRHNRFGGAALTSDRRTFSAKYPAFTVDSVTLEDIMLFYSRGEARQ